MMASSLWKVMMRRSNSRYSCSVISRGFSSVRASSGGDGNFDFNDDESLLKSSSHRQRRVPPEPIPNRPLRGERPSTSPRFPPPNADRDRPSRSPPRSRSTDFAVAPNTTSSVTNDDDLAFLDKFKLRPQPNCVKNNEKNQSNSNYNDENQNAAASSAAAAATTAKDDNQEKTTNNSNDAPQPPQDVDEIFRKMKETGLIPNAVAMLDGLCKDGLVQEAMKLFGLMRERGTIPEVVIYTAVVDGFCKAQKLDDAKRIFRKMHTNGIVPNAFSYTVLVQGLYKCNCFDDAVEFCLEMLEAGHSPNVTTFLGLVDGLCREKGIAEAQSVIKTLQQKGFVINDKAVREYLDKKAPLSSSLWEAIFGKKQSRKPF